MHFMFVKVLKAISLSVTVIVSEGWRFPWTSVSWD